MMPMSQPVQPLLHLVFLGGFSATLDGQALDDFGYSKVRALFAFLVMERGSAHARDRLAGLLWGDANPDLARANLRNALHKLRTILGDAAPALVQEGRQALRFDAGYPLDLDIDRFEAPLPANLDQALDAVEVQLALYRGGLLAGLQLPDAPAFERWMCQKQDALLRRALDMHQRLADHYAAKQQAAECIRHVRAQLALVPWQDRYCLRLMQLLVAQGDVAAALAEYKTCARHTLQELGSPPCAALESYALQLQSPHGNTASAPVVTESTNAALSVPNQRRLPVTVLACRVQALGSDEDEDVLGRVADLCTQCADLIGQAGGYCVTVHAGVMSAYFGYPQPQEMAPRRAVEAALALQALLAPRSDVFFGLGLDTGWMLTAQSFAMPDASGALTQQGAYLAQLALGGHVYVSETVLRATDGYFSYAPVTHTTGPRAARALRKTGALDRLDAARESSAGLTPLVGRDRELAELLGFWRGTDVPLTVMVQGAAGVGKSRLMQAAAELIRQERAIHLDMRCAAHREHTPYFPLRDFLARYFQDDADAPLEQRLAALQSRASNQTLALDAFVPAIATLLGLPSSLDAMADRTEHLHALEEAVTSCMVMIAQGSHLLLTLEDAHWADPSTVNLLQRLATTPGGPRMLLVTSRTGLVWANAKTLVLGPLDSGAARCVAEHFSQTMQLTGDTVDDIVMRCDGMPLYIEQMALAVALRRSDSLPLSLSDLLVSRLEPLGKFRLLAQIAAVLGREFDTQLLTQVWDNSVGSLQDGLQQLCTLELAQAVGGGRFSFKHALIRDAAYFSLPLSIRRHLHGEVCNVLLQKFASRIAESPEVLAHHLDAANDVDAAQAWLDAGKFRAAQSALLEAASHFRHGLEALARREVDVAVDGELEFRLHLHLGNALVALQGYGSVEAKRAYEKAHALSHAVKDVDELVQMWWGLWLGGRSGDEVANPLEMAEKLREVARQSDDPATQAMLNYALGNNYFWLGQPATARQHLERSMAFAAQASSRDMIQRYGEDCGITSGAFLSWTLWIEGHSEDALQVIRDVTAKARELGHVHSLCFALTFSAVLHRHLRMPECVMRDAQEVLALSTKHGLGLWQAASAMLCGWAQTMQGDAQGLLAIRFAVSVVHQAMPSVDVTFSSHLLESLVQLGQLEEASSLVDACIAKSLAKQDLYFLPDLYRHKAELTWALRERSEPPSCWPVVDALFAQGLSYAQAQQSHALELRLTVSRARLLCEVNDRAAAKASLSHYLSQWSPASGCRHRDEAVSFLQSI